MRVSSPPANANESMPGDLRALEGISPREIERFVVLSRASSAVFDQHVQHGDLGSHSQDPSF